MKTLIYKYLLLKTAIISVVLLFMASTVFSQQDSIKTESKKEDTTRIVLGKKEVEIINGPSKNDTQVHIKDKKDKEDKNGWKSGGFKGHWAGVELGLNNYLNKDNKFGLSSADEYMSLNASRSIDVNVNFLQHSFGIVGNRFGLVTGMGFEFYNYFFRHNNSIETDNQGVIQPVYFTQNIDRSKLTMTYLTVPLLFEFQFPGELSHSRRVRLSVGVIGGLKLGSHTKVVYYDNGNKRKDKNRDDFSINPFRYGFTARLGYKHVNVFADYYPVSLFEKDKGPVLYPVSVGIAFVGH